jgi:hypothetical protein
MTLPSGCPAQAGTNEDKTPPRPKFRLTTDISDSLLARIIPIDHPSESWPTSQLGPIPLEFVAVFEYIMQHLWGEPGWILIDTGLAGHSDETLGSAAWNLFTALCSPVPQYRTGELIYPVEVAHGSVRASSTYSQSNKAGGFHTDGTLLDAPPEIAMLAGIHAADEGGETIIIDGYPIVNRLREGSGHQVSILEDLHPFHSGDFDDPMVTHRIIGNIGELTKIRYSRRYIELGYAQTWQQLSLGLETALQALDALIATPKHQTAVLIDRGHALLWNNMRCLHGRRPFKEVRKHRRLLRTYGMLLSSAIAVPSDDSK